MSYDDFLEGTTGQLQFYLMERGKSTTGNKKYLDHQMVCSNHFQYEKPIPAAQNPTLYLVPSDAKKKSPRKRKRTHQVSDAISTPDSAASTSSLYITVFNPRNICKSSVKCYTGITLH